MMNDANYELAFVQQQLSSVWPTWHISKKLGKGSYGSVYEIVRDDLGTSYSCALKVLHMETQEDERNSDRQSRLTGNTGQSSPAGNSGQSSLAGSSRQSSLAGNTGQSSLTGNSRQSSLDARIAQRTIWNPISTSTPVQAPADLWFDDVSDTEIEDFVHSVSSEIDLMMQLKGVPNIVSIEDYAILRSQSRCTILIRMEKLEPLDQFLRNCGSMLNKEQLIRIGADICSALSFCEQKNILHRDIKTSNLFYSKEAGFKLGDFGISRTMASIREKASMSGIGTLRFMAPEVYLGNKYNNTADIYSLGIVLYTIANGMIPPLYEESARQRSSSLSAAELHEANMRRLRGEILPPPRYVDQMLGSVICTACNPVPEKRFRNAAAFRTALLSCLDNASPPYNPSGNRSPYAGPDPIPAGRDGTGNVPDSEDHSTNLRILPTVCIIIALGCILLFLLIQLFTGEDSSESQSASGSSPVQEETGNGQNDNAADVQQQASQSDQNDDAADVEQQAAQGDQNDNAADVQEQAAQSDQNDNAADVQEQASQGDQNDDDADVQQQAAQGDQNDDDADVQEQAAQGDQNTAIEWTDQNLRNAVLPQAQAELGISGDLSVRDAMKIQTLDLKNAKIKDISSLRYFIGLKKLDLGFNSVSDISVLADLRTLEELNLEKNKVSDLTPLSGLVLLKRLDLFTNEIHDISALEDLTQLTMLDIRSNYVSDISVLRNMGNMRELYMSSNSSLWDLSPISNMPSLWYLSVKETAVSDITPIRNNTGLTTLIISWSNVTDISVIDELPNLKRLDIRGCNIRDLGPANRVAARKDGKVDK